MTRLCETWAGGGELGERLGSPRAHPGQGALCWLGKCVSIFTGEVVMSHTLTWKSSENVAFLGACLRCTADVILKILALDCEDALAFAAPDYWTEGCVFERGSFCLPSANTEVACAPPCSSVLWRLSF